MNVLERIVDDTREEVARRRREVPLAELERARRRARRRAPVLRGADRARACRSSPSTSAARRSAGRDPRGRDGRGDRLRLRARRRGRAVDPHRAPPLRRLARRPARGARGHAPADPAQGLHRRPVPGLRVRGRRAPTRSCSSSPRWTAATSRACYEEARAIDLDVLVEVHDEEELDARARGRRRRHRHQQPRPRRLHASTSSARSTCSPTCRRARPSSRSRASHSRDAVEELERVGVDAVLVGELLMRAPDPEEALTRPRVTLQRAPKRPL